MMCKGITIKGEPCRRKLKNKDYCKKHSEIYRQLKPDECIVCCESLSSQKQSLSCGHWVHTKCVILSAKAECPVCRQAITLGPRSLKALQKMSVFKRGEEEEEFRIQILQPALQEYLYQAIGQILRTEFETDLDDLLEDEFFIYLENE